MGEPTLTNPVWCADGLVPAQSALVGVSDHGFTVGDGVFETLAVRGGEAVARDRHVARLMWSAARMGMASPDAASVNTAINAVLAECDAATRACGRMRLTWTSGDGPLGSARGAGPGTLVVWAQAAAPWPATSRLAVCPWPRNENSAVAGVKTTSYAENVVALAWARGVGADEAVFLDTRGNVSEGTGSNLLLSLGGRLVTPALTTGCLAGITRALVLQTCDVAEVEVGESALRECAGAAVLSSTRDVHPVAHVLMSDGSTRDLDVENPLIAAAAAQLASLYARTLNP
ncbi:MAG: aminotransferase class IV [Actinomycetales bacterium]|nr:aminotransferase class IV [Actinomycetales bacterium]